MPNKSKKSSSQRGNDNARSPVGATRERDEDEGDGASSLLLPSHRDAINAPTTRAMRQERRSDHMLGAASPSVSVPLLSFLPCSQ